MKLLNNILITGTPGTGKSTLSQAIAEESGFEHININELAKEKRLYDGFDDLAQCHILDEDQICNEIENKLNKKLIIDYHSCDFFPERWFSLVIVLQTDNTILYDRLLKRNYKIEKIKNNVTCEIMHAIVEEARENYNEDIIKILKNDTIDDFEVNCELIKNWIKNNV